MTPALINNPLFRGITPEKLSANLEEISFHTRSYKKGEILARQGDVCNRLMILTKGSVRGPCSYLPLRRREPFSGRSDR